MSVPKGSYDLILLEAPQLLPSNLVDTKESSDHTVHSVCMQTHLHSNIASYN